jgi:hypothetical protein
MGNINYVNLFSNNIQIIIYLPDEIQPVYVYLVSSDYLLRDTKWRPTLANNITSMIQLL